jgi:hypothetical protein
VIYHLTSTITRHARLPNSQAPDPSASVIVLRGHEEEIRAVAFSLDGRYILTGSHDRTARVWPVRLDDLVELACRTAVRNLAWDEWQQFFPGKDYRATCPELPVHSSAIAGQAQQGKITEALAAYQETQQRFPVAEIGPETRNTLCRYGSLWGQAAMVLDICAQAVQLAPNDGRMRDSRGLARALTGNIAGAIEDFEAYIAWAKPGNSDEQEIARREAWVAELRAGRNPFDQATLEALRSE